MHENAKNQNYVQTETNRQYITNTLLSSIKDIKFQYEACIEKLARRIKLHKKLNK